MDFKFKYVDNDNMSEEIRVSIVIIKISNVNIYVHSIRFKRTVFES